MKALAATDYKGILGRYVFEQKNHTAQYGPEFIPIPTAQIRNGAESSSSGRPMWPRESTKSSPG